MKPKFHRAGFIWAGSIWAGRGYRITMAFILWLLSVILVVSGIVALFRKEMIYGIVLIVVGFLVGPGGVSLFT